MPTYEYKCKACHEHFEVEQSITDDSLTSLPGCAASDDGDHPLKKVFSAVGIAFKGEGFYRNDSRPTGAKSKSESNGEPSSSSPSTKDSSNGSSTSSSDSSSSSSSDKKSSSDSSSSKTSSSSTGSGASSD